MTQSEIWLTVEQVAERFQVHPETIRRLIKKKKLKAIKVGGEWRISPESLRDFMDVAAA